MVDVDDPGVIYVLRGGTKQALGNVLGVTTGQKPRAYTRNPVHSFLLVACLKARTALIPMHLGIFSKSNRGPRTRQDWRKFNRDDSEQRSAVYVRVIIARIPQSSNGS